MMDEEKILSPVPADAADILPQKPRFRPVETLFAWLLLVFGYFFLRVNPMWDHLPFAAALLAVSIYAFTFLVLLRGRCRFGIVTRLVLLSAALALLAMLIPLKALMASIFSRMLPSAPAAAASSSNRFSINNEASRTMTSGWLLFFSRKRFGSGQFAALSLDRSSRIFSWEAAESLSWSSRTSGHL